MRTIDQIIAALPTARHAKVAARGRKLIAAEAARRTASRSYQDVLRKTQGTEQ